MQVSVLAAKVSLCKFASPSGAQKLVWQNLDA